MKGPYRYSFVVPIAVAFVLASYGNAEAYVDPGNGSMLVQLVIGVIMAIVVVLRSGWQRIRAWVRRPGSVED
jgi:hypothetical protein